MIEQQLIYKRIAAAMKDIEAIGKNQTNAQQRFKFRGIDDVYNSLHDVFSKHELFSTTEVLEDKVEDKISKSGTEIKYRILKIKYTIYTSDGSNVSGIILGEAMDSGDKAANKAMAIAHKYFLTQLFLIPTSDNNDADGSSYEVMPKNGKKNKHWLDEGSPSPSSPTFSSTQSTSNKVLRINANQLQQLQEALQLHEVDLNKFYAHYNIKRLLDLDAKDFTIAIQAINSKPLKTTEPDVLNQEDILKGEIKSAEDKKSEATAKLSESLERLGKSINGE